MHGEPRSARRLADRADLLEWEDSTPAAVVRVLDTDESRPREVAVIGIDVRCDVAGLEQPVRTHRDGRDAGERRHGARLEEEDVRVLGSDRRVARPRPGPDRDLVRHGARRHQQRRLLAEALGGHLFEAANRGILAVHVVPDLRARDSVAHLGRRARDGVTAEVDHSHRL